MYSQCTSQLHCFCGLSIFVLHSWSKPVHTLYMNVFTTIFLVLMQSQCEWPCLLAFAGEIKEIQLIRAACCAWLYFKRLIFLQAMYLLTCLCVCVCVRALSTCTPQINALCRITHELAVELQISKLAQSSVCVCMCVCVCLYECLTHHYACCNKNVNLHIIFRSTFVLARQRVCIANQ
jgi:hypothetical protein